MGYTLIDHFNGFEQLKREVKLSANVQAAYYTILGAFNSARYPARLSLSVRELQVGAGLKSVDTAHEAKNVLKNYGLIDFSTEKRKTVYELKEPYGKKTYGERKANGERTKGEHREKVSSSIKVIHKEREKEKESETARERGVAVRGDENDWVNAELARVGRS